MARVALRDRTVSTKCVESTEMAYLFILPGSSRLLSLRGRLVHVSVPSRDCQACSLSGRSLSVLQRTPHLDHSALAVHCAS
jgi:hypothetical protein